MEQKIIILLLCSLMGYAWSMPIKENTKSTTQTIVSLDSVLENLINKATLVSVNNLTQEECEKLQYTYNANSQDSQNDKDYSEEQSCYYVAIQNLKTTTAELIAKKHIATDTNSLNSILHYKIIAFLSTTNLQTLRDTLGFEVTYHLQNVINICHRLDGLEFEASCNLYMQIFDDLARYVAQKQNLPQKAMQDYQNNFEQITQDALDSIEQELPDMP